METPEHHPALWKAIALAFTGLVSLGSLSDNRIQGWWVWADIVWSSLLFLFSILEMIILTLEQGRQNMLAAAEATRLDFLPFHPTNRTMQVTTSTNPLRISYLHLPFSPVKMRALADGLLAALPFSERQWVDTMHVFSGREFRSLQDELAKRRWIQLRRPGYPRQGYELCAPGKAAMRYIQAHEPVFEKPVILGA